mmetsp:Transcript_20103/g.33196  ORF Transcript_20103/g.33196 Transcript_20103/m.33196 type:complete len:443 (+) Transcript_20103:62-1390(+)
MLLLLLLVSCGGLYALCSYSPKPIRDDCGNILDPVGGSVLKNGIGMLMAVIAKYRERSSSREHTDEAIERFHATEDHKFFNESYYFNGSDLKTKDRIISRISHRGRGGAKSYVFLLLDLERYGQLSLEQDHVDADVDQYGNPRALGLVYECLEPMKRWRIKYTGKMKRGCVHPQESNTCKQDLVDVKVDMLYSRETPVFWYMRDDTPECLGKNLSQEPWGLQFLQVCLKRSKNHGHYEDYGRLCGTIRVNNDTPIEYDMGTFRDHSWDIRSWKCMESLLIVLVTLEQPLILFGHEYWYLDLTLVSMPGNSSGVARYSTGYVLPKDGTGAPTLALTTATSVNDIPWKTREDGVHEPMPKTQVVMNVRPNDNANAKPASIRINMNGPIRRLMYWPDDGGFVVYEDSMDITVTEVTTGKSLNAYGTRQSGHRVGTYDPTVDGGCG